jgi:hypothetical protein
MLSSALKMEAVCFSETLASTCESVYCYNPEEHHHLHCHENHKSQFCLYMYSVSPNIKKESHTNQTYRSNITVGDKRAVATWVVLRTERSYFQKLIMLQAHES